MKKQRNTTSLLVLVMALGLASCTSAKKPIKQCEPGSSRLLSEKAHQAYDAQGAAGNPDHGAVLFASLCADCHKEQGIKSLNEGVRPQTALPHAPKLACNYITPNLSDAYLFATIKHGRQNNVKAHSMPAWKTILSDEEVLDLVAYIISLARSAE